MQIPRVVGADDRLRTPLPARCPKGLDGSGCRVGVHGHRERKTGPEHRLVVARCHAHGCCFTLYPPGYVPYGRVAVEPVDAQGRRVQSADGAQAALFSTGWEPVASAAKGERYGESGDPRGSRRTQGRRLGWAAQILGLSADARPRERLSKTLQVPALMLHEAASAYASQPSWRRRAEVLMDVLHKVLAVGRTWKLVLAGHVAGLWGRPSRWDPGGQAF